jgi:hypothetical protein
MFLNKQILKLLITAILCISWVAYRLMFLKRTKKPWQSNYCVNDTLLLELFDLTKTFSQNLEMRDILMIANSVILDGLFLLFGFTFLIGRVSFKPIANFILFTLFKCLTSLVVIEKYSIDLFNHYPGFPSILFDYKGSEQFVASYPGYAVIIGLAFWNRSKIVSVICFVHAGFMSVLLMLLRANYSIDIAFGFILAHYTWYLADMMFPDGSTAQHVPVDRTVITTDSSERNNGNVPQSMKKVPYENI